MRLLRVLGYIIAVLVGVVLIVLAVSVVLSPPWAGKKLADELAVPHRAVIAHRGASGLAPEGTAPAYLLAQEMGVDYLEADLQRTKDGVIVVYHDDTLARTTDVAQVFPGRENDTLDTFTYEELMHLDAGSWFNVQFPDKARDSFAGLRILTLEQLADIAAGATGPPPSRPLLGDQIPGAPSGLRGSHRRHLNGTGLADNCPIQPRCRGIPIV